MRTLLLLTCLFVGINANAMICTSEENFAKKIELNHQSPDLVTGSVYIRTNIHVFAGKVEHNLFEKVYTLFNQEGKPFTFTVQTFDLGNHCRARVCHGPVNQKKVAKLSNDEIGDEYFECL